MDFAGRVALVTGGGTGVGKAVTLALAQAGVAGIVVNYSRSAADAEATAEEARALGADALAVQADVSAEAEVIRMVAETVQHFGRLDVLVNNAGTTRFIPLPDLDALTDDVWENIQGVNVRGAFYCSRAAASALRTAGGGIVNVASIAGLRASGSSIPYMVSKAGLLQLTRSLAAALAPEVRVNAVIPGLIISRWFRQGMGDEFTDAVERQTAADTPLQFVMTPEHVAQAVMGLLAMDGVTGEAIIVDGGKHLKY